MFIASARLGRPQWSWKPLRLQQPLRRKIGWEGNARTVLYCWKLKVFFFLAPCFQLQLMHRLTLLHGRSCSYPGPIWPIMLLSSVVIILLYADLTPSLWGAEQVGSALLLRCTHAQCLWACSAASGGDGGVSQGSTDSRALWSLKMEGICF